MHFFLDPFSGLLYASYVKKLLDNFILYDIIYSIGILFGDQHRKGNHMEYIYSKEGEPILIETEQKAAKEDMIKKFRSCRKALGLSQSELSTLTGIAQSNIARFESGKYNPSLEMMVRIAKAMGKEVVITLK